MSWWGTPSCYESFQVIIIVISWAVVMGAAELSTVANFRSPPCTTNHQTTGQSDRRGAAKESDGGCGVAAAVSSW